MIELPDRICRSARRLRHATLAMAALLGVLMLLGIAVLLSGRRGDFAALEIDDSGLAPVPGAILLAIVGILIVVALLRLARMLGKVGGGAPFGAAADLRGFAFYLFLAVIAANLGPLLLQFAAAAAGGEAREIRLSFGMSEILMLLVSGLIFLVAKLLDEAQRIADDASQIV